MFVFGIKFAQRDAYFLQMTEIVAPTVTGDELGTSKAPWIPSLVRSSSTWSYLAGLGGGRHRPVQRL